MSQPYSEAMVMRPAVTYTLYATSSKEQTGNVFTFAQIEVGNILTETHINAESGDESDNESIIMSEQDMENINSGDQSDHDLISTEMLEYIRDGSQTYPNVNKRESRYKISDRVRKRQSEWKGALKGNAKHGKRFTQGIQYDRKGDFAGIDSFGRIWFRSFPFHSRA